MCACVCVFFPPCLLQSRKHHENITGDSATTDIDGPAQKRANPNVAHHHRSFARSPAGQPSVSRQHYEYFAAATTASAHNCCAAKQCADSASRFLRRRRCRDPTTITITILILRSIYEVPRKLRASTDSTPGKQKYKKHQQRPQEVATWTTQHLCFYIGSSYINSLIYISTHNNSSSTSVPTTSVMVYCCRQLHFQSPTGGECFLRPPTSPCLRGRATAAEQKLGSHFPSAAQLSLACNAAFQAQ